MIKIIKLCTKYIPYTLTWGGGAAGGRPAPLYWYIVDVCCNHFDYVDYSFDLCFVYFIYF